MIKLAFPVIFVIRLLGSFLININPFCTLNANIDRLFHPVFDFAIKNKILNLKFPSWNWFRKEFSVSLEKKGLKNTARYLILLHFIQNYFLGDWKLFQNLSSRKQLNFASLIWSQNPFFFICLIFICLFCSLIFIRLSSHETGYLLEAQFIRFFLF